MPVTRLNHAVLYVRDVERTREFYENVLGFRTLVWAPGQAAFFQAPGSTNDHDLGAFQIGSTAVDGPAVEPIWKAPRSWSLVEPGAWKKAAWPGAQTRVLKPRTFS